MRLATACDTCKSYKRKCRFDARSNTSCISCVERRLVCSGPKGNHRSRQGRRGLSHAIISPTNPPYLSLPPLCICERLVAIYFDLIHDQFHSIFHRPSFCRNLAENKVPEVVLLSIVALAARFSDDPYFVSIDPRERGRKYADKAKMLLRLDDVSLSSLQTCILIGSYTTTEGNARGGLVYYSAAIRMADLLRLPESIDPSSQVEHEIGIRTLWTLFMLDTWAAYGLRTNKLIPKLVNIRIPMEETKFWRLQGDDPPSSPESIDTTRVSLLAQMGRLNSILCEFLSLGVLSTAHPLTDEELVDRVEHLSGLLESWRLSQPLSMGLNSDNLKQYAAKGLGRMFVAVHLGYYNFGLLLFYRFLDETGYRAILQHHNYGAACKYFAKHVCEAVYLANSTPGCEVKYMMVGHLLAVASTVHIHTLLFSSDDARIMAAKLRLEKNFEIICALRTYWPALDITFRRFREFHDLCQKSGESSFQVDDWVLRFLLEFANPEQPAVAQMGAGQSVSPLPVTESDLYQWVMGGV